MYNILSMRTAGRRISLVAGTAVTAFLALGFVLGQTVGRDSVYRYLGLFAEVYQKVRENYVDPVDGDTLMQGACDGVTGGLDPFSGYLTKELFQAVRKDPLGGPAETGIEALRVPGGAIIAAVKPGSPAARAGLRPGDQIWSVEGRPARQLSLLELRRAQRGAEGSAARLLIFHPKTRKREEVSLRRALPAGPGFESSVVDGQIGYLRILDLARVEREPLETALRSLRQGGAARLLIDLRSCAEGSVDDAVRVAGIFVPSGPIVTIQPRGGAKLVKTTSTPALWSLPVSVLENAGCAGGGEVLAEALRSRLKAPILGEPSYGLGTSQELMPLPSGDGLILSTGLFVSPSGESWNKSGIKPDREIPSTFEERAGFEPDSQLKKAIDSLKTATEKAA